MKSLLKKIISKSSASSAQPGATDLAGTSASSSSGAGPPASIPEAPDGHAEDMLSPSPPDMNSLEVQERLLQQAAAERAMREDQELQEALALSLQESRQAPGPQQPAPAATATRATATAASSPAVSSRATSVRVGVNQTAEAEALAQLNEVVSNCLASDTQFVDPEFAPSLRLLYSNGRCRRQEADQLLIVQHYEKQHGRDVQWRRPGEIFQRPDDLMMDFESRQEMLMTMHQIARIIQWRVFQSDPQPTDISQGALGNCWFCGSLAAVAEKPYLIKRLFVDDYAKNGELSPVGVYLVRLCDGGEWRFVQLDDNFPCNAANMLAYSGARRNQLWVPLVEKAFAKLRGCYEDTEGGNPCEGLRLLTGWPSIVLHLQQAEDDADASAGGADPWAMRVQASIPFTDEELLWVRLVSAFSAKLIVCGSCGHVEGITKEMYRGMGLSPSHCYSIVHVAAARGGSVRLVKLRNPWGTGLKWKGAFADTDHDNWTPDVKAEVGAEDLGQDGGIFWMTLQDLRKYFNSITICPYREGWNEFRSTAILPATMLGPQPGFFIERPGSGATTEALLSLMQPEERQSATTMTADLGLVLLRVPVGEAPRAGGGPFGAGAAARRNLRIVDSIQRQVRDTAVRDHFIEENSGSAGLLAVPLSFNQRLPVGSLGGPGSGPKSFTFAAFTARQLNVHPVDVAPEVVRDALVSHVMKFGQCGTRSQGISLWKLAESGLVCYLENASAHFVELTVELTELFNMTVSRGVQGDSTGELSMFSRDVIPPMHGMLVFVAAAMPAGHSYRFTSRFVPRSDGGRGPAHTPPLGEPVDTLHNPYFLDGRQPERMMAASATAAHRWGGLFG